MYLIQIFAFLLAIGGFIMTFWALKWLHMAGTKKYRTVFGIGISCIVIGTLVFFVESLYQGVVAPSATVQKQPVQRQITPVVTVSSPSAQLTPQTFTQQFMPTCRTMLGQNGGKACACILDILEKNYTSEQLQNIKSPSDIPASLTASIASCVQK